MVTPYDLVEGSARARIRLGNRSVKAVLSPAKEILPLAILAVIYVLAGKWGLWLFAFVNPSSAAVWPPTGIAFAACLLLGYRVWPALFIGAFIVNLTTAGSIATSIGIATGNTLEALAGAYLVNHFANGRRVFNRAQDIFKFVLLAASVSTLLSATIGATTLGVGGYLAWSDFVPVWLTWWLGDAAGNLLVAPLIVLWNEDHSLGALRGKFLEAALLFFAVVVVGAVVFGGVLPEEMQFLCAPVLIWTAFRFGLRETATAAAMLLVIAAGSTLRGVGPFARDSEDATFILLQAYIAITTVMALALSASVEERKRAEAETQKALGSAEVANRLKDEFLAVLGHELRNPLSAISGAVVMLERARDPVRNATARSVISRQTRHLTRLMEDLLDIARITTGTITLERKPMDLARCVAECVTASAERSSRQIRLESVPVWITGDPDRVAQIITNLLSNALKYTPEDGIIGISIRAEGDRAVIRVRDTGAGIPADLLPHIFEFFVRGRRDVDRPHAGLGVGLALVRRLVELNGGAVEAKSDGPGYGSTFTVRFAQIPRQADALAETVPPMAAADPRRILIIDDNVDVRESFGNVLQLLGHEVVQQADGLSGIQAALAMRPEVALIDIGLPDLDGYEVARRLRASFAGQGILLVAVSGYGQPEDRQKAIEAGFDWHLVKPVDSEQLSAILATTPSRLPA